MDDPHGDRDVELVDLSGISLVDLRALGDAPLAHSLRRIFHEIQNETADIVSDFESSIAGVAGEDV
ncbi:MAG: FxSxx-COOH cyclophane-containing RiPP peptide [Pseudonocardiaceae bacterium]